MDSLRAFAKASLSLLNNGSESSSFNLRSSSYIDIRDEMDFDLSYEYGVDINEDAKLFHILNKFITMLNNRDKFFYSNIKSLYLEEVLTSDPQILTNKIFKDSKYDNTYIAHFIRYNLLNLLRISQDKSKNIEHTTEFRNVLTHWWSSLIDLLKSDTRNYKPGKNIDKAKLLKENSIERTYSDGSSLEYFSDDDLDSSTNYEDIVHPSLSIELISVILESISRIMTNLMTISKQEQTYITAYSDHILRTVRIITSRIILNHRLIKELSFNSDMNHTAQISFCNNYNSLIRSILGKLLAFAFIYLPDELDFDIQFLKILQPDFKIIENSSTLYQWKKREFIATKGRVKSRPLNDSSVSPEMRKLFKVFISYVRSDLCFISFYWHYWYIIFHTIGNQNIRLESQSIHHLCPGSDILIYHSTLQFLRGDLYRMNKFMRNFRKQNVNSSINDSMPNADIEFNDSPINSNDRTKGRYKMDGLDEYFMKSSKSLKIWNCLKLLSEWFPNQLEDLNLIYSIHDNRQLNYIKTIPAYDFQMANIVYNKILHEVITTFEDISFLNWDIWSDGYLNLLNTCNMNSQIIAILSLFNTWDSISIDHQKKLIKKIVNNDNIWNNLALDTTENLTQILFAKFLIFKISSLRDREIREIILGRLMNFQLQFDTLTQLLKANNTLDKIEKECNLNYCGDSVLLFHVNKKFILGSVKSSNFVSYRQKKNHERNNWIVGPLDINCRKDFKGVIEPPEITHYKNLDIQRENKIGFKVLSIPKTGKSIEYWNQVWSNDTNYISIKREKELPSVPMEKLNTSLFGEMMNLNNDFQNIISNGNERTQYQKLFKFTKLFNLTMLEYYDFLNFDNNESIVIDFDLFK